MNFFRPLVVALVASSLLLSPSLTLQAQSALPNLGDDTAMTLGAERRIGDQIAREIYRDAEYVSDPVLDAYIANLWQPLLVEAKRAGVMPYEMDTQFAWQAFLIRDKSVNAFALPGGYFGVHLGLIAMSQTPDALASVLAHETTHVTQRHISRGMSKDSAQTPWLVASILLGLLAMRTNPQMASAAIATGQAATIQGQLNFSRSFEREADRIGFMLMQPAGYDPQGFVEMFEMLGKASRLSDSGNFPYLRTHPLSTERVADMRSRVGELNGNRTLKTTTNIDESNQLLLHRLMAVRASVMADKSVDAQKFYLEQGEAATPANANFAVTQYAAALAAWQTHDVGRAKRFYERLKGSLTIKTPPTALQAVNWLGAELGLPVALDVMSSNRVEMSYAARQILANSQASKPQLSGLTSRLQNWVSEHPKDADAWRLLSNAQTAQNQRIRSIIASAEASRAQLDDSGALAQYQAVQKRMAQDRVDGVAIDSFDAAIVDSKVRELQQWVQDLNRKPVR